MNAKSSAALATGLFLALGAGCAAQPGSTQETLRDAPTAGVVSAPYSNRKVPRVSAGDEAPAPTPGNARRGPYVYWGPGEHEEAQPPAK